MHPPAHIQLDDLQWPLLIVRYTGIPTNRQFEEALKRRESYLERGEQHVIIHDMSQAGGIGPPEQRHILTAWRKRHDARLRGLVLGVGFVTDLVVVKLMLSLVFHLKPLTMPHVTVTRVPEAVYWAAEQLWQSGFEAEACHIRARASLLPGLPEDRRSA